MSSALASIAWYAQVLQDWISVFDFEALSDSNGRSRGRDQLEVLESEPGMAQDDISGGHAGLPDLSSVDIHCFACGILWSAQVSAYKVI